MITIETSLHCREAKPVNGLGSTLRVPVKLAVVQRGLDHQIYKESVRGRRAPMEPECWAQLSFPSRLRSLEQTTEIPATHHRQQKGAARQFMVQSTCVVNTVGTAGAPEATFEAREDCPEAHALNATEPCISGRARDSGPPRFSALIALSPLEAVCGPPWMLPPEATAR